MSERECPTPTPEDLLVEADALYGEHRGFAHVCSKDRVLHDKLIGEGRSTREASRQSWREKAFKWPDERAAMGAYLAQEIEDGKDVYRPQSLFKEGGRRAGNARPTRALTFELDAEPTDRAFFDGLGAFVVSSSPGHYHVTVFLNERVNESYATDLAHTAMVKCGGTGGSNGGKFESNGLTRWAGSWNRKYNKPIQVGTVTRATTPWDPSELEAYLGGIVAPAKRAMNNDTGDDVLVAEKRTRARVPDRVASMLSDQDADDGTGRNDRIFAVVSGLKEAGWSPSHVLWLLEGGHPVFDRWEPLFSKADEQRHTPGQELMKAWAAHEAKTKAKADNVSGDDGDVFEEVDDGRGDADLPEDELEELRASFMGGGEFIFDVPDEVPTVWGDPKGTVLWAEGQPLLITGPIGVGKTTIAGLLCEARMGFTDQVLGFKFSRPSNGRVLYLAMDRPLQARSALGRQLRKYGRKAVGDRLVTRPGPPPSDLAKDPTLLLKMAVAADADTVFVDSLKDAVTKLIDDEAGGGWNRAVQMCIAAGIEVVVLHHQRKANGDNGKPKSINDVYGSVWLAAGMGSVMLMWGEPSATQIEVSQLRSPTSPMEPVVVKHDHAAGSLTPMGNEESLMDELSVPMTVATFARVMHGTEKPEPGQVEAARRLLDKWVREGAVVKETPQKTEGKGRPSAEYRLPEVS